MQIYIKKILYILLTFFIALFISSSFFIRAEFNYSVYDDNPIINGQNLIIFIPLIILIILLSIVLYKLCLRLNPYSKKIVIPVVLLFSFAIQLIIIYLFTALPTADSQTMFSLAQKMLDSNDYSTFEKGGYLYMFPFNFSTVLYFKAILSVFPNSYTALKIFNILFTLITTLMIYLIYKELNYKSKENDYGVLVFAATFIPSLFMCNYIYNDIISTTFLTTAIFFIIKFIKQKSIKYIIISSVFLSIGNYLRCIGIIILIAAIIYILLSTKSLGIKKIISAIGILIITFTIPGWTQNVILRSTNIVSDSAAENSAPVYMWLNMGINLDRLGFWDNLESYNIYQVKADFNKEKSIELFKESIKNKLSNASFSELTQMYYKKIIWFWTEGTYQIDRYGIADELPGKMNYTEGGYTYTTFATDLFKGDSNYRSGILWICYVMNFLMYCFIFIRLISGIKTKRFDEVLLILIILGFIGFYILWEIKSRYVYPVYPILIILSYMGFKDTFDFILKRKPSK